MRRTHSLLYVAFGTVASFGLLHVARANEGSWLHRQTGANVCVSGNCVYVDHSWGESLDCSSSECQNDNIESMNSGGSCGNACGPSIQCEKQNSCGACATRPSYNAQWSYSDYNGNCSYEWTNFGNCYANSDAVSGMTYGWNGVCHQATNRGFYRTSVPWVSNMPFAGSSWSLGIWGYCGANNPWGTQWGCGC